MDPTSLPRAPDETLSDASWQRFLLRDPDVVRSSGLYGALIGPPRAADGCFVLGRIAQSLDGFIATRNGASFWISGEADILHTHRLRALCDAIVVGAGTVAADDPQLTTRACSGESPVRVVIDTDRRLPDQRRVFAGGPETLVFCASDARAGVTVGAAEICRVPRLSPAGPLSIPSILAALAARGLRRIFVEGGGVTVSRFLAAGALDRLHVTIAPLLLGAGIPAFTLPCPDRPDQGMRVRWHIYRLGSDLLLDIPLDRARPPMCC
jgi:riboflavin-specific deaminase-like protein